MVKVLSKGSEKKGQCSKLNFNGHCSTAISPLPQINLELTYQFQRADN